MPTLRIGLVIGSLRAGSFNRQLADAVRTLAGDRFVFEEIGIGDLPLYDQDDDAAFPATGLRFKQQVEACDALLFVTPEYNRSIPGALKNAIDFIVPSVLANKAVGLVSYSYYNGFRPVEHLRDVLVNFTTGVVGPQVNLSLVTDFADGAFAPADFRQGEIAALVEGVVTQDKALATLR